MGCGPAGWLRLRDGLSRWQAVTRQSPEAPKHCTFRGPTVLGVHSVAALVCWRGENKREWAEAVSWLWVAVFSLLSS